MPSGAKMRSRRKVSSVLPVAREIRMPRMSEPLLYIHFSPGWCASGRLPHRFIAGEGLNADRIDVRLTAPADERDETGHPAAFDMAGHGLVHAGEARLGQSAARRPLAARLGKHRLGYRQRRGSRGSLEKG